MAAGCVIGVDLGGTKLLAGVVDAELKVHHSTYRLARPDDESAVVNQLVETIAEMRGVTGPEVLAVGVGVPGLVDPRTGVVQDSNHLPLQGVPLRDVLAERTGLPVAIDNDGNAALLAEARHGAARGARHVVLLTLGTGIGGGVLADGRLLHGARGAAAELGHMIVEADGPPCPGRCPNHGCLEALVSGHAIGREGVRVAQERPDGELGAALARGDRISGLLVSELARAGDEDARAIMTLMGERLGLGIVTLANVFNPEVVVVGGGAIGAGELLLGPARAVVARRALPIAREGLRIEATHFGAEAGMLGAAVMALELVA